MPDFEYTGAVGLTENVLASRYASPEMVALFSPEAKVYMERGLWIGIMEQQAALGVAIPEEVIDDYRGVQGIVDLAAIREREKTSHHDVNARIEEFNALARHQTIQQGMTSRDLTENIEQFQIAQGLDMIKIRMLATLARFAIRAVEFGDIAMAGRSHNVAAQTITLGKRFSNYGEELLGGFQRVEALRASYALRGIKGPVGTQQDMLDLLGGDPASLALLEANIAEMLGFGQTLGSVGQVYPRSMDFDVVTALKQATSGPVNFANSVRLMAGAELATEGFAAGQVGSNAMPHKMNAAKSERIAGLSAILTGHVAMAGEVASRQWNEGDVSCSAARRVFIPDAFYAADGILQTSCAVLDGFGAYPAVINTELQRYLPFLTTTKVLMAAIKAGLGREDAHAVIKGHAVAVALDMREKASMKNDLFERLGNDPRLPMDAAAIERAVAKPMDLTGMATTQTAQFAEAVWNLLDKNPEAIYYKPNAVV